MLNFSSGDSRHLNPKLPSKCSLAAYNFLHSDYPILLFFGGYCVSFVAGVLSQDVEAGIRASIGCGLFWGLIEILASIVLFAIVSYFSLSLRTYGFHKGDKVFLIDFKNEEIVSAKIQSLNYYDKSFNETGFNVLIDNELYCIHDEDI